MKKHITIIGVLVLVIIGFGYYTLLSSPASETSNQVAKDHAEFSEEGEVKTEKVTRLNKGIGSLESLRLLNENLECNISYAPEDKSTVVEGTYFISDKNIRVDFLTDSPDLSGQVLSSIIIDGPNVYVWSEIEDALYGMRMSVDDILNPDVKSNEPVPLNEDVHYDCKPWENVDNTVFIPPSNVIFQNLSDLMNTGMEYGNIYEEGGELPY